MDTITDKIIEIRLITEGAVPLYERKPEAESDDYSLIGEALYLLREILGDWLKSVHKEGESRQNF